MVISAISPRCLTNQPGSTGRLIDGIHVVMQAGGVQRILTGDSADLGKSLEKKSKNGGFLIWEFRESPTRWCPSSLAKLVQITPISLWFMADITIVFMGFINQLTSLGGTILYGISYGILPGILWLSAMTLPWLSKKKGSVDPGGHGLGLRSRNLLLGLAGEASMRYPAWLCQQLAIENGHRNSGFSH